MTAAAGNAGKYIHDKLPCYITVGPAAFNGKLRTIPVKDIYGDSRYVTGRGMERQSGQQYVDIGRERAFVDTSYECVEEAPKEFIDEVDEQRTANDPNGAYGLKLSKMMNLQSTFMDRKEYKVVSAVTDTATYPTATVAALAEGVQVAWNAAGSSPTRDYKAIRKITRTATGETPTWGVISHDVLEELRVHPETVNLRGDLTKGVAIARDTELTVDETLMLWARRWGLVDGLFPIEAMYNSANPALAGVLAEMSAGKVAFHCARGIKSAVQVVQDVQVRGGLVSFAVIEESAAEAFQNPETNPRGTQMVLRGRYTTVTPLGDAKKSAFVLSSVLG